MALRRPEWLVLAGVLLLAWLIPTDGASAALRQGLWLERAALIALGAGIVAAGRIPLAGRPALAPWEPVTEPVAHRDEWIAWGLVALGLALRLPHLGAGLWYDEIRTLVEYGREPIGTILTTYDSQNQHLFYSVLARLSLGLFGDGAAGLRVPAALLGTASLYAVYRFARPLIGSRQALLAMALLTVSYHHVWFSQNARGYTGLLFFTVISTGAFLRLLSDPRAGWPTVAGYALATALAVYVHVTAALVGVAQAGVLIVWWWRSGRDWGRALRPLLGLGFAVLVGLVLYGPVVPQLTGTLVEGDPNAVATVWRNPLWLIAETVRGLARGIPGGWVVLPLGLIGALAGLAGLARRSGAAIALMMGPPVLTALVVVGMGHNLWPRFFFFTAGFAVIIAVHGAFTLLGWLAGRRGPALATAILVLGVAGSALTVPAAWGPKQDYEGAARFVTARRTADDAIVTVDLTSYPYQALYRERWTAVASLDQLEAVEKTHQRTWVVYTFPVSLAATQPGIWERLQTRYDTAAVYPGTVGGGTIVVMVSRPSATAS